MHRREVLKVMGVAAAMPALGSRVALSEDARAGRLKQSVSRWPYAKIPLGEFCRAAKAMGLAGTSCSETAVAFLTQLRANHTEPLIVIP